MSIQVRSNEKPPETPPASAAVADNPANNAAPKEESGDQSKDQTPLTAQDPNASLQNQASDSEPEGTKAATPKEGEADQDDEGKEPGKKKGGFQRRIDKLNAQKAQAERELDYWRGMALKNAGAPTTTQTPKTEPAPSTADKPNPETFDSHADYVEALTDWKTEQKLKERDHRSEKERLNQEQTKIVSNYTDRMKSFSEKTADFQDVISEVDHIPLSPALREIILTSENGPQLAYELAKNPGEYERIAKLPPLACAREMGRFETRLSSSSVKTAATTEKKITQAPRPIDPVGTGKGTVGKSIFDSNLSQMEYEALRKEQMKQRRRA